MIGRAVPAAARGAGDVATVTADHLGRRKTIKIRGGLVSFPSRALTTHHAPQFTVYSRSSVGAEIREGVCWVLMSIGRYRSAPVARAEQTPLGIAVGIGAVAMVATAVIAAMIPAGYPGWRFGVITAAMFLFAAVSLDHLALAVVAVIGPSMTVGSVIAWRTASRCSHHLQKRRSTVPDVAFVLVTVALFAVLMLIVRGAEKL